MTDSRHDVARLQEAALAGLLEPGEFLSEISPARARQLIRQLERLDAIRSGVVVPISRARSYRARS